MKQAYVRRFYGRSKGAGYRRIADVYLNAAEDNAAYFVAELLVDFDELWIRWRSEHQTLAERMIGRSRGTGGTAGDFSNVTGSIASSQSCGIAAIRSCIACELLSWIRRGPQCANNRGNESI